jgi:uncharacterized membrane protein YedE/YeeE
MSSVSNQPESIASEKMAPDKIAPDKIAPGKGIDHNQSISSLALTMSLVLGVYFGIVLTKSEVVRWQRVHDMFLFNEAHMYLIIGVGVVVAMLSMLVIKRLQMKTIEGKPIKYKPKPFHTGVIIGGTLFGAGWAITGACPGPIYAQIGSGVWMALFTLAGAMVGMYCYALLREKLPH